MLIFNKIRRPKQCETCYGDYHKQIGYDIEIICHDCKEGWSGYISNADKNCKKCHGTGKMKKGKVTLMTCSCVAN